MRKKYDWSRLKKKINISEAPGIIYDHWCIPQNLEDWMVNKALYYDNLGFPKEPQDYIEKGDQFEWYGFGPDGKTEEGTVIEANQRDFLKFSCTKFSIVSVRLILRKNYTIVGLEQKNIPVTEVSKVNIHLIQAQAWSFYLLNLKTMLEGKMNLRNTDFQPHGIISS